MSAVPYVSLAIQCSCNMKTSVDCLQIDYKSLGCEVVMECTGVFLSTEKCKPYFDAGIKKIVVSAPFKDSGDNIINIVKGCNEARFCL